MSSALCLIKPQPHYRRSSFEMGLLACGYQMVKPGYQPRQGDLLCIWNRCCNDHQTAIKWEQAGAVVVVCENGYIGKDSEGQQLFAMSLHGHNGSGRTPAPDIERLVALNLDIKPWRAEGSHILVCGQRGIGSPIMASSHGWHDKVATQIATLTRRAIRVRRHPGNHPPPLTLEQELKNAYACVIWSSGAGIKALTMGIPVIYQAPHWIAELGASHRLEDIRDIAAFCNDDKRFAALRKVAASQFSLAEIRSGEAFRKVLTC